MKPVETAVGAFEAKNTFSDLLDRVGRGAAFTITKHDRPVARLVPARTSAGRERKAATAALRLLRKRYSLKGVSVRGLIGEGRR